MRLVVLVVVAGMVAACGGETSATEPPADDVVVRIVAGGEVVADWTLAGLESEVPFTEIVIDGDSQNGPLLLDVLAVSGIDDWSTGEVLGLGEGRAFEVGLDISSDQVDEGWILDVTKQGTLKLASADLPREQWVRDVGEISIP